MGVAALVKCIKISLPRLFQSKTDVRKTLAGRNSDRSHTALAEDALVDALSDDPDNIHILSDLAELATERKDWSRAAILWEKIIEIRGRRAPATAFVRVSSALRNCSLLDEAEGFVNQGLESYANNGALLNEFALLAMSRRDWAAAVNRWERVQRTGYGRGSSEVTAPLIRAHRNMNDLRGANALLSDALKRSPRDVRLLAEQAVLENYLPPAPRQTVGAEAKLPDAEIIVCVYNALDEVRACLESVSDTTHREQLITVVDDGSKPEVHAYLQAFVAQEPARRLLTNDENLGYTKSANRGLQSARVDWAVLLNSDTLATRGWLDGLLTCAVSDTTIRAVGPVSNAATFQSLPWSDAALQEVVHETLERVSERVRQASFVAFPRVPMLNGFCMMLHTPTLNEVGFLDEVNFPQGYGEENDLCLRLLAAGHKLAIADNVFVYHARSASFGLSKRLELTARAVETLRRLWPGYSYAYVAEIIEEIPALRRLRQAGQYRCPIV